MKFGVIGLGNIAQKAYLPTYSKLRHQGTFIFATRNAETRRQIGSAYGFAMVETLAELLVEGIEACFIHAATKAHYDLAKQCLENNVHVFMDKPVSENIKEVEMLQLLAAKQNCLFMTGFNRRYAPLVEHLKQQPEKRLIQLQKNRIATQGTAAFMLYDLFLHVVDTAVYLLADSIKLVDSKLVERDGNLELAYLHLETPTTTALVSMDLNSGANTELYQVTSPTATLLLRNLTELTRITAEGESFSTFGDWETTLYKRGFEQLVTTFMAGCRTPQSPLPRQEQILLSHQLCEAMLRDQARQ